MRIQSITPIKTFTVQTKEHQNPQNKLTQANYSYNPIAYKDLTFGARLFRTPENFYLQDFNRNGMPQTMKEYLFDDYEDRQKMPPAQMLKLVFDDINETQNLEQIKRIFPNEKLFANLTDTPTRKARTGILAEIDLMREDGKTLFKNGKDNLGHYIIKKIYTESKTLKEINEDFKRDISVHYKDLSPIEYSTLAAYGIKFPNNAFWKSLTATREEFPYEYKPRKANMRNGLSTAQTSNIPPAIKKPKNRFESVKSWEIDKLAEAMVKGGANQKETKRQIQRSSVRDEASLNFVARYMSEINSVVLEKLHVSPEMKEFFEDYENLTKSQKQKLDAYWSNPETKELRSKVMQHTIRFFMDTYGVDGQNEEFQELLQYARNIKPNRIAQFKEHNRIQAEYDEMFAKLDAEQLAKETEPEVIIPEELTEENFKKFLEETSLNNNVNTYTFHTEDGDIVLVGNLDEMLEEDVRKELEMMPRAFTERYLNSIKDNVDERFILSNSIFQKGILLPEDERLMDSTEMAFKSAKLWFEFESKNRNESSATKQALLDIYAQNMPIQDIKRAYINPSTFNCLFEFKKADEEVKNKILRQKQTINTKYNDYKKPLTDIEARKITMQIFSLLRDYNVNKSAFKYGDDYKGIESAIVSLSYLCSSKSEASRLFKNSLNMYIKEFYGGSTRMLINPNISNELKQAKLEEICVKMAQDATQTFFFFVSQDPQGVNYIRFNEPELYKLLQSRGLV